MPGSGDVNAGQHLSGGRKSSTVIARGLITGVVGIALATGGYWFVGFGIATSCTDIHVTGHGCDAMYRWMHVGVTVQWALAIAVIALLALGLAWPASRKAIAVTTWVVSALALAWFAFYMYSANQTF